MIITQGDCIIQNFTFKVSRYFCVTKSLLIFVKVVKQLFTFLLYCIYYYHSLFERVFPIHSMSCSSVISNLIGDFLWKNC